MIAPPRLIQSSAVLFFASPRLSLTQLSQAFEERYERALTAGCTTMGEIGPDGLTDGALSAISIDAPCAASGVLVDLDDFRYQDGARIIEELGWRPRFADLDTILRTAWEWHRDSAHGI